MKKTIINLFAAAIVLMAAATFAGAATFTVTNTADSGTGSLRQAITNANAAADADTIVFASPLFDTAQTINLTGITLFITNPLTITGRGARLLNVRGNGNTTVFVTGASAGSTIRISGMTISNGGAGAGGSPSGVDSSFGSLTLDGVTVSGNTGDTGAVATRLQGTTTILNSTISNNNDAGVSATFGTTTNIANTTISGNNGSNIGVGGIIVIGTLNMNNVTVTNNTPIGVFRNQGTANIRNSIISGNANNMDVNGAFTSNGNNLIGNTANSTGFTQPTDKTNVAANLAALANNGGQTDTHKPNAGSPAIDAGNNCVIAQSCIGNNPPVALTTDQRGAGFARQNGTAVDIGAFESAAPTAAGVSIGGRVLIGKRGLMNATVYLTNQNGETLTSRTTAFGYYHFDDITAGQNVVLTVVSKRYRFEPQVVNLTGDLTNLDFDLYQSPTVLQSGLNSTKFQK